MTNFVPLKPTLIAMAVAASAAIATPALANSAASADITAPIRAAESARSDTGPDAQFSQLFASWQKLDGDQPIAAPARSKVSIPYSNPIEGFRMTSGYGMREHPILGGRRKHDGVDLASPVGTPVHATADGVVERASWFGGYGLCVELDHGAHLETRYGHMSRLAVAEGQHVRKGDVIGYVGSTGRSTGPHLHYEVRIDGQSVNPLAYMHEMGVQQFAVAD